MKKILFCLMALCALGAKAVDVTRATIVFDKKEDVLIKTVTQMLSEDVERVCGTKPAVTNQLPKSGPAIVVGTVGTRMIDRLVDGSAIKGQWERFIIKTIGDKIVVAGSDRRGTAYGCLAISEAMGVNPWYWWADVPVPQRTTLGLTLDSVSPSPKVKYRGIFINDEDWGLKTWSARNYEKELGDIGPRTYARVCELLLRLKGNMLAPAMHACTGPFYSHPESKVVANQYGIHITTSHCEPLLFNNATKVEWDSDKDGPWDFNINREGILKKLDARVKEAAAYDNIYTLAMRGLHDAAMQGNLSPDEKVRVLQDAIMAQRDILKRYAREDAPQIFIPYKEAMDSYERGLQVPDDVTLVWVDDNYGYMKRLPNATEQQRKGRGGVYYHISYLGTPHDYLWINTTPPALMYEELSKAYRAGADRYWLLNVGDIKPMELGMQTFFEMALDPDRFTPSLTLPLKGEGINSHQAKWLKGIFGVDCQLLLDEYYRLAWSRKPEYMGWEIEWDAKEYADIRDTEFSFQNYSDAQWRLADYDRISTWAAQMMESLPENLRPAFFEIVAFQVMGAAQMNRKFLMAQLNHELAAEGRFAEANWAARQAREAFDSVAALNTRYNKHLGGKWDEMMHLAPAFRSKNHLMPPVTVTEGAGEQPVDITPKAVRLDGCAVLDLKQAKGGTLIEGLGYDWCVLPLSKAFDNSSITLDKSSISHRELSTGPIPADSVTVILYTLPFFPIDKEHGTRIGVSLDGAPEQIAQYKPKEWSYEWKINVLRNGHETRLTFPIDRTKPAHTLTLHGIDDGQMVQRIILDWGGLKKTYIGPRI